MTSGRGPHRRPASSALAAATGAVLSVVLVGCGITVPADPDGTLSRVTGNQLRVGVSPEPGLVRVSGGTTYGSVVDLVEGFADAVDADVEWTIGTEESLVRMLEEGELDLVAGGFTADTPWVDKVGVTRGFTGIDGADGRALVMLVPQGENAFLSRLEIHLDEEVG